LRVSKYLENTWTAKQIVNYNKVHIKPLMRCCKHAIKETINAWQRQMQCECTEWLYNEP